MFTKITHAEGLKNETEILFSTPFDYLLPDAARSKPCLLPQSEVTVAALKALGNAMSDTASTTDPQTALDSNIPAIFTYFGQFIDHDITARTDRDGTLSELGNNEPIVPLDPDVIVRTLRNGRRPQLDLDSVFGEGPGLVGTTQSQTLYDGNFKLNVFDVPERVDLPRTPGTFQAVIADMRNDENVNISQLQSVFLKFYNAVYDEQMGDSQARYSRARQLVRWAYQYVVLNSYLPTVCDPAIVRDMLANGPRFLGATAGKGDAYMPLEFSIAGFRFAHSMIRPFYKLSALSTQDLLSLLGPSGKAANFSAGQLKAELQIDWRNFIGNAAQRARKIDTKIAHDLFTLPLAGRAGDPVLAHLARSNLLRAYNLSIPSGQAMCDGFGINPLTPTEITTGEDAGIKTIVQDAFFDHRSPLWYYLLREAAVQQGGQRLGELGSRIVAETLLGLLKQDPNSYLNNRFDPAVKNNGIDLKPGAGGVIKDLIDLIKFAGFTV